MKKGFILTVFLVAIAAIAGMTNSVAQNYKTGARTEGKYRVITYKLPESKFLNGRNKLQAVVLHHTACATTARAIEILTNPNNDRGCHVVIDRDGTRHVLASPTQIPPHAGYSYLNGKSGVSTFSIGIEFQSIDTNVQPLTEAQIESAIDYLIPIIRKYNIPLKNIVTHEQVRRAWLDRHPDRKDVASKCDISQADHKRFMAAINKRMNTNKRRHR